MARVSVLVALLVAVAVAVATNPARDGQRVLVLLDTPATKETHSVFFGALEGERMREAEEQQKRDRSTCNKNEVDVGAIPGASRSVTCGALMSPSCH